MLPASPPPQDTSIAFGRYRLLALLGEGGMACVYRARLDGKMGFQKEVALKRLPQAVTKDHKTTRALINEARLGGRLRHANIVETYELDEVSGHWYMALELVDGWPLDVVLQACRAGGRWLPLSVAAEVFDAMLDALDCAHDLRDADGSMVDLVHRDLKPGNVMVGRSGCVKLMDFGVAKAATNLFQTTAVDSTKGTPAYMSPEQVRASPLDRRSDLFSLGSILHELVTLEVPFQGDNLGAIVGKIMEADLEEPLARIRRRCPPAVGVATRLLAKTPEERYPDAAAVRRDFVAVRAALPPGPTLSQWLTEVSAALPAPRLDGDFGVAGPPAPVPLPGAPAARPAIAIKAEIKPPPPRPLAPPTAGSPPRLLIALGLVIAGLLGALVVAVVLPIVTPPPVVSAEGLRADLLTLDEASLVLLTNSILVKQAARYVDQGKPLHLKETEGTVTASFPNGTVTSLAPGLKLEHTDCTCDAEGVCLHRVVAVLAYQGSVEGHAE